MLIITIEAGIFTGAYTALSAPDSHIAIVDLDASATGDNPVGIYEIEDTDDMPVEAKRLLNRHGGFIKMNGGRL